MKAAFRKAEKTRTEKVTTSELERCGASHEKIIMLQGSVKIISGKPQNSELTGAKISRYAA